jgi:hypothetical protein
MSPEITDMLDNARSERNAGRSEAAEQGYSAAAARARAERQQLALGHALRHVSDLARERGSADGALGAAAEAVAIYRAEADARLLDLANALRLNALALTDAGRSAEAATLWQEARELYSSAAVQAGVDEANVYLGAQG